MQKQNRRGGYNKGESRFFGEKHQNKSVIPKDWNDFMNFMEKSKESSEQLKKFSDFMTNFLGKPLPLVSPEVFLFVDYCFENL